MSRLDTPQNFAHHHGPARPASYSPIRVPCPKCGHLPEDGEPGLTFGLANGLLFCPECDEQITGKDLQQLIDQAQRLLAFLDLVATI